MKNFLEELSEVNSILTAFQRHRTRHNRITSHVKGINDRRQARLNAFVEVIKKETYLQFIADQRKPQNQGRKTNLQTKLNEVMEIKQTLADAVLVLTEV